MKGRMLRRITSSPEETGRYAKNIARLISRLGGNRAVVVELRGELGAGKTVFARHFLRALGVKEKITSPTFVLLREYKTTSKKYPDAYHLDAYRLLGGREAKPLRLGELTKKRGSLLLVEWPEKIKGALPRGAVTVRLRHGRAKNERVIELSGLKPRRRE